MSLPAPCRSQPKHLSRPHPHVVVYEHVGVAVLRKAWVNLDGVWAAAIVAAGLLTLFT